MHIAVHIDGQFNGVPSGIQYYTDSLLGALYGSGTEHEITAFAPGLYWQPALERAVEQGLFAWRHHPRACIETAGSDRSLADHPRVAGDARLRSLARKVDGRVLSPLRTRTGPSRARAASRRFDVLHLPEPADLQFLGWQAKHNVVTIHDVATRTCPWAFRKEHLPVWERYFAFARDCASRVLTVSESSKRDIVEHLGIPGDRIDVAPNAARSTTRRVEDTGLLRRELAALGLEDTPFVLYAGTLEPRKNVERLVRAFGMLAEVPDLGEHKLVLAGGNWNRYDEEMRKLAAELHIEERVVITGFVSVDAMNALMSACRVFAYVSEYEGFGMPPLEAMVCGAPVVASNTSSLPEVVGDAGIQVPPHDIEAIAEAIRSLLTDEAENARRRTLSRARAEQFTWARTAQRVLRSYEAAVS